jgi:small basic protein
MIYIIIGLFIGIMVGYYIPFDIPRIYGPLLSVAFLASIDSVLGAFCATFRNLYKTKIFLVGFFMNSLVASLLCYAGMKIGIDLYLVGVFVFGFRIFKNLGEIRRYYID